MKRQFKVTMTLTVEDDENSLLDERQAKLSLSSVINCDGITDTLRIDGLKDASLKIDSIEELSK